MDTFSRTGRGADDTAVRQRSRFRSRLRVGGILIGSIALALQVPSALVATPRAGVRATPSPTPARSARALAAAPSSAMTTATRWANRRNMKMNSQHAAGAVLGARLYVVGGQVFKHPIRLVQSYNPTNNKWKLRARLPAARMDAAAVAAAKRLYAVGGASSTLSPTRTLYSYNPRSNRWSSRASMPSLLTGVAAASGANGGNAEIFVFGGADGAGSAVSTTFIYDTGTNSWVAGHALPAAISHAQAVRVGASIYVLGGLDATGQPSLSVYIYDIASDTFSTGAAMLLNDFGPIGAVAGQDGRSYTVGLDWGARRVDTYNPESNTWTTSSPSLQHPQA